MDRSEIRTGQVDNENRKLKGLQNRGIVTFECVDCGKPLLCLQLTSIEGDSQTQVMTRVAVKCGFCDGFSYVQQISGQFYPGAPNDQMAFDVADDDTNAPEVDVLFKAWSK